MDISPEGAQYVQRYHVHDFPHIAIIDPRTGRLMWKKEGWTQENPVTAESFAEMAMDFCSRNSFDRPPQAPRPPGAKAAPPKQKPLHELSEDEQLQAAMRASMEDISPPTKDEGDDEVECLGTKDEMMEDQEDTKPPAQPSFIDEILKVGVPDEPAKGARMQLRMPDGKRVVRRFNPTDQVKVIYAFLAVSAASKNRFLFVVLYPSTHSSTSCYSKQMMKPKGAANSISWPAILRRICLPTWTRLSTNAGFPAKPLRYAGRTE